MHSMNARIAANASRCSSGRKSHVCSATQSISCSALRCRRCNSAALPEAWTIVHRTSDGLRGESMSSQKLPGCHESSGNVGWYGLTNARHSGCRARTNSANAWPVSLNSMARSFERHGCLWLANAELSCERSAVQALSRVALQNTVKALNRNASDVLAPDSCSGSLESRYAHGEHREASADEDR